MTHDHVEKWVCPRSAGARLSTRETGYEAKECAAVSQLNSLNSVKGHHKYRLIEKAS